MVKIEQTQLDNLITAVNNRAKKVVVTTYSDGLMSASDKTKLNSIAANATSYTLPAATSSTLGGIRASISGSVLTLNF